VSSANTRPGNIAQQRRSQRVLLSVALFVSGKREDNTTFHERAITSVVNAHGALIRMEERVRLGQILCLKHIGTGEEMNCKVVDVSLSQNEGLGVGVEFVQPSPRFWRVTFPPADWSQHSPEAKRFEAKPAADSAFSLKK
jgi:hypothetical protein